MSDITDEDFLAYCSAHAETLRCGFTPASLARLYRLAGEDDLAANFRGSSDQVIDCREKQIKALVDRAWERLRPTDTVVERVAKLSPFSKQSEHKRYVDRMSATEKSLFDAMMHYGVAPMADGVGVSRKEIDWAGGQDRTAVKRINRIEMRDDPPLQAVSQTFGHPTMEFRWQRRQLVNSMEYELRLQQKFQTGPGRQYQWRDVPMAEEWE